MSESEDKPFQGAQTVKLVNGEEVVLPRLTLGKIMALTKEMTNLIDTIKEKAPEIFNLFGDENVSGIKLAQVLPQLLPVIFEQVVTVLSIYLNKPKEWIKDAMDMEDLTAVAVPFFAGITKQANHLLGPISALAQKTKNQEPEQQNPSSESSEG